MKKLILILFNLYRPVDNKLENIKPKGINHTIVPQEFTANFPVWDEPKNKIIYVN